MCSPILIAKLQQTFYDKLTAYALLNSSVLRWLQTQDDDEDKSQMAAGREFQAAGLTGYIGPLTPNLNSSLFV